MMMVTLVNPRDVNRRLPRWPSVAVVIVAAGVFAGLAWWFGLREPILPTNYSDELRAAWVRHNTQTPRSASFLHDRGTPNQPLEVGTVLPPMEVEGWINGNPSAASLRGKVLVLDIWDDY